jgi:hypothetical protein
MRALHCLKKFILYSNAFLTLHCALRIAHFDIARRRLLDMNDGEEACRADRCEDGLEQRLMRDGVLGVSRCDYGGGGRQVFARRCAGMSLEAKGEGGQSASWIVRKGFGLRVALGMGARNRGRRACGASQYCAAGRVQSAPRDRVIGSG